MNKLLRWAVPVALLLAACDEGQSSTLGPDGETDGSGGGSSNNNGDGGGATNEGGGSTTAVDPALEARVVDYNEALRTASLKLVRRLPTLDQIRRVQNASSPKEAYKVELDAMLATPAFNTRMFKFWRDTMRMGGADLDSAPAFAAKLMAENRPFTDLFTATTGACPSYDTTAETFGDGDCQSGAPVQAGVLTNPAVMKQFYGNMAFRRARWVQETFYCSKFPAEVAATPTQKDGKDYTSPWSFDSIANDPIPFKDTQSVVCANCHTSLNHIAPLFANFDQDGMWQADFAVMTPVAPEPIPTQLSHYLVAGETLHWRLDQPTADLGQLGAVIAEDPAVSECMVARMWNFAMSKEDIITDLATVPFSVVEKHVNKYDGNGQDLKAVLRDILLSDDFVSF